MLLSFLWAFTVHLQYSSWHLQSNKKRRLERAFLWYYRYRLRVAFNGDQNNLCNVVMKRQLSLLADWWNYTKSHLASQLTEMEDSAEYNIACLLWKRNAPIFCYLPLRSFPKLITRSAILQSGPLSPLSFCVCLWVSLCLSVCITLFLSLFLLVSLSLALAVWLTGSLFRHCALFFALLSLLLPFSH